MEYIIVLITTPNKKSAEKIAQILIEKKLAGCVNIVSSLDSIYHWKGKIEKGKEFLLIIKSKKELFKLLAKEIKKIHPYEVPEIISLDITQGDQPYLEWLKNSVK